MLNLKKPANILLIISASFIIFSVGYNFGALNSNQGTVSKSAYTFNTQSKRNTKSIDFKLFWDTWSVLDKKFVDKKKLDPQKMYYGAIKGMVASLGDQYTFFLTPGENKKSKDDLEGKFEGIGAQLGLKDNRVVIIAPLKDSPAEKAGARSGDIIIKVDGKSTKDWTLQKAVSKIRGKRSTKVTLTVQRKGNEIRLVIKRDQIIVPSIELKFEKGVAILKLNRFGDDTNNEWKIATDKIQNKFSRNDIKGLVLDLRDNPGGFLQSAIFISSEFLPLNKLVVKQQYGDDTAQIYRVDRRGALPDIPLVVLINNGSASASEIVAGALRDHKRARLIGTKSFGKGSIQEAIDLSENAGIHVTVAKWILPNGDWINGKGIKPDIEIKNITKEGNTLTRDQDLQLEKAIDLLLN